MQRIFPLASMSRPVLGPTQPPVQWVPGLPSLGLKRGWGVTLTTHPIYCRGRTWVGAISSLPPSASVACGRTALAFMQCHVALYVTSLKRNKGVAYHITVLSVRTSVRLCIPVVTFKLISRLLLNPVGRSWRWRNLEPIRSSIPSWQAF
jgi:hypothetical protein